MSLEEKIITLRSQLCPTKQKLLEKRLQVEKKSKNPCQSQNSQEQEEIYVLNLQLSVSKHWVLDEHRIMGKATLPGTAYLEIARAACEDYFDNGGVEMKEVYFLMPLVVEDWEEKAVRVLLKKQQEGFEFMINSQSKSDPDLWSEHAKGKIAPLESTLPLKHEIQEIESSLNQHDIVIVKTTFQSELMEWGSRWSNCQWIKLGTNQGLALLELPEAFINDFNSYKLHPALLDSATGFLTIKYRNDAPYLPFSYKRLKIKGNLPSKVYSYIKVIGNNQPQTETLTFNVIIMDHQGIELVEIEEYTLRKFTNQQFIL